MYANGLEAGEQVRADGSVIEHTKWDPSMWRLRQSSINTFMFN